MGAENKAANKVTEVKGKIKKKAGTIKESSRRWLERHINDPYVQRSKKDGYRSRAAYKLIELDERYHLIRKGALVLDLGAAPGGWTQVALQRGAARVVGIDLLPVEPIPGATLLQGDIMDPAREQELLALLGGKPDLVLSDMAPNTTGHAATDHIRIMALAELTLEIGRASCRERVLACV